MAELHDALTHLAHVNWEDLPHNDLPSYLSECFAAGELLINSVPLPPNGTAFESSKPHFETPNSAKSAKDVYPSPTRPPSPHDDHEKLRRGWGKAMKFGKKENPLDIALYKMAGHDRHGAWFARHQVFEGISYTKFKKAMLREFPETLLTTGEPGAGAIRGLSAERRVERIDVGDTGRIEVYQLSAQMPSPVSPRDFLTLFLTTDGALSHKSPSVTDGEYTPRHYMVVSKALDHPDAPQRSSHVRGSYESVELIREVPLHLANHTDPELNPIEWIMVTRSDPAGGIPRFLIDRGTPGAMLSDIIKFLDWACSYAEVPHQDVDLELQRQMSEQAARNYDQGSAPQRDQTTEKVPEKSAAPLDQPAEDVSENSVAQKDVSNGAAMTDTTQGSTREAPTTTAGDQSQTQEGGVISNLTSTLEAGVQSYAPAPVSDFLQRQLHPEQGLEVSTSDSSSEESFLSAEEMKRLSTAQEYQIPDTSGETISVDSAASSVQSSTVDKKSLNRHDREVLKILHSREKLDEKLAKKRQQEQTKYQQTQEKEASGQDKARERMEKEIKKNEERHQREVEKLEVKRERELVKAEQRRKKKDDQNKLSLVARERDDLRSLSDLLRRENALLADQVEALQRENTAFASRLGKIGGPEAVRSVQEEIKKSSSIKSGDSRVSLVSGGSGEKKEG